MRRLIGLLAVLTVTSCAGDGFESTTSHASDGATSSPVPVTTTTTSIGTTTVAPGPPVGWMAPSGVPLAITTVTGDEIELLTPCGNPVAITGGDPIYEVEVVLDPGHGGPVDTGAVGPNGLAEKEVNLRVALRAGEILEERGIRTVLTRTGDYPIPIPTRVDFAHLMGADVLVSIHHNAPVAPSSDTPGVEIFVQHDSPESQRLGGLIYDESMDALGRFDIDWDRSPDAGVMTVINSEGADAYGMVRLPEIPSALVELGFIANAAEADLFRTHAYVSVASTSVADAVETFLTTDTTGSGLVEGRTFDPRPGVGPDQCVEPSLDLPLYPDVISAEVTRSGEMLSFDVTISSGYDSQDRYADAFRIVGDDGQVYGVRELTHDHANEQPFTRSLGNVEIPASVAEVFVEARDQLYGWGGESVVVVLP